MPNLGKSAKLIFGIYAGYIIVGTSLWLAGMPVLTLSSTRRPPWQPAVSPPGAPAFIYFAQA
jgi:hypothetical protein